MSISERLKAWLKSRDATTPCAVLPGDIIRIHLETVVNRDCVFKGVNYGSIAYDLDNTFEWEATRPFRTMGEAVWAAHQTVDIRYVQMKDTI